MTTMDSDSESQDSDDGRRFRFEATRKDNVHMDAKLGKLPRSRSGSGQGLCHNNTTYEDKKDKSKYDCNRGEHRLSKERDVNDKDLKYSTKYTKNLRREDGKDQRNERDISSDSKSAPLSSKHKTRDTKRHKNRDRTEHRSNRSQDRCRSRNENDRSQNEKHRNRSREKYKHHACDRSREKSYQSYKMKSSEHDKLRGETERYTAHKKTSTKDDEEHRQLQEYPSSKNIEQRHSGNELLRIKRDISAESQEHKELNLSEFDILSETDENMSDSSEHTKNKSSLSRQCNMKTKKRNLNNEYESTSKKQVTEIVPMDGSPKVNAGKNDEFYGSSNNNSGTISDSTLGTASPILTESRKDTADLNSKEENFNSTEQISFNLNNYGSVKTTDVAVFSSHMYAGKTKTYGPALPPQFVNDSFDNTELNKDIPKNDAEDTSDKIKKETLNSINPDRITQNDFALDSDIIFGPALPPHLLKQKSNDETNTKVIGPAVPHIIESFNNNEVDQTESEGEHGIGPLPANHPSLGSNSVYRQLEQRAQQFKTERTDEDYSAVNKREEWMTELPPNQISNLGLTSRKFRVRAGPDMRDRSCWTDTPAKKAERQKRQEEEKLYVAKASITELSKQSDESECWEGKKREKSLLEIHRDKLRKKKRKEEKKAKSSGEIIRRPFDRDVDLQVNRFDQARKNAVLSKAQRFDERFSRGKL
ncbi:uncharacterized protein LOC143424182 [Xylocopa sonorina]|uniref:uncharacterized protein LOC143424182 n=1 Tax=Xylocopa sonorina TaxID=1818115 RepID=UPI00403A7EAF